MSFNLQFDPRSIVQAFQSFLWWEWLAIAVSGWAFTWLIEGRPLFYAFLAQIPNHPVLTVIAIVATVWCLFTSFSALRRRYFHPPTDMRPVLEIRGTEEREEG